VLVAVITIISFSGRFVKYRAASSICSFRRHALSPRWARQFLFETSIVRFSFLVYQRIARQGTQAPFDDEGVWTLAIPFAAAACWCECCWIANLSLLTGFITAIVADFWRRAHLPRQSMH
jgi:hypothetical protein